MICGLPCGSVKETRVQSLGQEDPIEKGMATHSSMLACRIPWTEEPGGLTRLLCPWDHKELDMTEQLSMHAHILYIIIYIMLHSILLI